MLGKRRARIFQFGDGPPPVLQRVDICQETVPALFLHVL